MAMKLSFTLGRALVAYSIMIIFFLVTGKTPSALSQNSDASGEAKQFIGTINRAQQAYFLENDTYAGSIGSLSVLPPPPTNYKYVIVSANRTLPAVTHQARPVRGTRQFNRAVIGGVVTVQGVSPNEQMSISKICIARLPPAQGGARGTESMIFSNYGLDCPSGYEQAR
jgi:type II secretory pathway pseudopilin PulG